MTGSVFDENDPVHAKALGMLERDRIAWITTVAPDGSPRAVPVWFFWHDGILTVLSEPHAHKVDHIRRGSPVLVHLHAGGPFGDDVVVVRGTASIAAEPAAEWIERFREPYTAKYAESIDAFGMSPAALTERFSVVIDVRPEHLLAW